MDLINIIDQVNCYQNCLLSSVHIAYKGDIAIRLWHVESHIFLTL